MNRPRIFVSIPSYRDRECQWTLRDMFERARHPERVFAGVCWQSVPEEDHDCFLLRSSPTQVRTIEFHALEARGLGWARAKAQSLWQGEKYSFQIDSPMRFSCSNAGRPSPAFSTTAASACRTMLPTPLARYCPRAPNMAVCRLRSWRRARSRDVAT
jgi:Glycosyltransferase (GlcNAc)